MLLPSTLLANRWLALVPLLLLILLLREFSRTAYLSGSSTSLSSLNEADALTPEEQKPLLPSDFASDTDDRATWCAERHGTLFLENTAQTAVQYCTPGSPANLTCFRSHLYPDKVDSFCIGTPAEFHNETMDFHLACDPRNLTESELLSGVPPLAAFPEYWYNTGPRTILGHHVDLAINDVPLFSPAEVGRNFSILVRREEAVSNVWHHLMQVASVFTTLDVMQIALNNATGQPFFKVEDIANTQVVIFDEHEDGLFYDHWRAFAGRGVVKAKDLATRPVDNPENIIIPIPGSANPLWKGDWKPDECEDSELLRVFGKRMARFYGFDDEDPAPDRPLVLTFSSRKGQRSMVDEEKYVTDLRARYPNIIVNLVNFASLSFGDQISTVRGSDILAGVHGAGLTHALFLPPKSALVEIMPPTLNHKGFRNMAKELGHQYFTTHATEHENYTLTHDWHVDQVWIEQDRFDGLMDAAIRAMYQRGLVNEDVN